MKKIFRKAMTVFGSAVLLGATVGAAAAAAYPAPFTSNTAVVYGAGAADTDFGAATDIVANLDAASTSTGGVVDTSSTTGDVVALDTSSTRIWLNTSLTAAKTSFGKTELFFQTHIG